MFKRLFSKTVTRRFYSQENIFQKFPNAMKPAEDLKKGIALFGQGNFGEARKLLDTASFELSKTMPEDHPLLAIAYNNLAECIKHSPESLPEYKFNDLNVLYLNSINIWMKQGENEEFYDTIATITNNYGIYHLENGSDSVALPWFEKALKYRRLLESRGSTENDTQLGLTLNNRGIVLTNLKKLEDAMQMFVESEAYLKRHLTTGHPDYLKFLFNYGNCLLENKMFSQGRDKFVELFGNMGGLSGDKAHIIDLAIIKTSESFIHENNLQQGVNHMKEMLKYDFTEGHKGIIYASIAALMMHNKSNAMEIREYAKMAADIALKQTPGLTGALVGSLVDGIKSKLK